MPSRGDSVSCLVASRGCAPHPPYGRHSIVDSRATAQFEATDASRLFIANTPRSPTCHHIVQSSSARSELVGGHSCTSDVHQLVDRIESDEALAPVLSLLHTQSRRRPSQARRCTDRATTRASHSVVARDTTTASVDLMSRLSLESASLGNRHDSIEHHRADLQSRNSSELLHNGLNDARMITRRAT